MKKRIVHIISSLKRGGAETLLVDLLAELNQYEHHVIYFHGGPNRQRLKALDIKMYHVKGLIFLYDPIFFMNLWWLIKRLKPDCIHSTLWAANFSGRLIAKLQKIPLVSVMHWGIHQDGKIRNIIDRLTFHFSQKVVTVSQEVGNLLKNQAWIPTQNIITITNGVNIKRILTLARSEHVTRADLHIESNIFVVGFVGRFVEIKNIPLLINAIAEILKKHDKIALILLGFGPLEDELKNLVKQLNIEKKVHFIVGRSAYGYYHLFDCFVLPSFQEGMSIALLEAMCFSLPCIVTSPTMNHEVICSGQNGFVIPSNSKESLIEKLLLLIEDNTLKKDVSQRAIKSIEHDFNGIDMVSQYTQLLEVLVNRKKHC